MSICRLWKDGPALHFQNILEQTLQLFYESFFGPIVDINRRRLRDLLRNQGVLVAKGCNINIVNALIEAPQTEVSSPNNEAPESAIVLPNSATINAPTVLPQGPIIEGVDQAYKGENRGFVNNVGNLLQAYSSDYKQYDGSIHNSFERKCALYTNRCKKSQLDDDVCR